MTRSVARYTGAQTDEEQVAAPGAGKRIVIDKVYATSPTDGDISIHASAAGADPAALGQGLIREQGRIVLAENKPILVTTAGDADVNLEFHVELIVPDAIATTGTDA